MEAASLSVVEMEAVWVGNFRKFRLVPLASMLSWDAKYNFHGLAMLPRTARFLEGEPLNGLESCSFVDASALRGSKA